MRANPGDDVTVLYHGPSCADGFCAAWCMRRAYPAATFLPVNYGGDMPDVTGRRVFFVDFCPTEGQLRGFVRTNPEVVVLDHHASAKPVLDAVAADNLHVVFDAAKSVARLAWEYAAARTGSGDCPLLVSYTEARDLWTFHLPYAREINAAIRLRPLDFEAWNSLEAMLQHDPTHLRGVPGTVLETAADFTRRKTQEVLLAGVPVSKDERA